MNTEVANATSELPPFLDEREKQLDRDYEWCLHDPQVQQKFGGKVVAASGGRIWGVGTNHDEAWEAARRQAGCPPSKNMAWVVVPQPSAATTLGE